MSESFVAGPNRALRQLVLDRIFPFLFCVLVAFAISSTLEAQNKNQRAAVKATQAKAEKQKVGIVFDYNPTVLDSDYVKSELAFVAISADGSTQAVRYGPYNPAIMGVYEGKLPKAEVAHLVDKARMVIPKASRIGEPYVGSCDANSFQMSLIPQKGPGLQPFMLYPGCLIVMPKDITEMVDEMRMMWKRLNESPLAYGYIRSLPLNEDFLKSPQRSTKQSISIEKFPPKLRPIVRSAQKQTPKFYAVTRTQYDQLLALTSDPSHFYVMDNGRAYSLSGFFLSRKSPLSPPSLAKGSVTPDRAQGNSQVKGWHGMVPLQSTRQDVERLIGHPTTPGGSSYQTSSESVYVQYSDGPCEKGWPFGWNVARDTVVMISVSPKRKVLLADLNLNETKYQKWHESHLSNVIHYTNHEEGIDIQADEGRGIVIGIAYTPTAADSHLKCPEASRRSSSGRTQADSFFKFDSYGDIPFSYESERLDNFAAEMQRQPDAKGYIIAYAGIIAHAGDAKFRAECAKRYVIKKHHIKAEGISAIDGGYREAREVELYVEPREGPVPLAAPSVRPSKIRIIGQKKPTRCGGLSDLKTAKESEAQHQRKSVQPKQSKAEKQRAWIVFDYTPSVLDSNFEKSEFAFVAINTDGSAQAVRYGPYNPAIIGVYEGKLPKAEVAALLDKVRTVIPKASKIGEPYVGSCDADSFQMSVIAERSKVIESNISDFACLPVMPKEIFELAQEMRTVWQRLRGVPLAYGYLRRSPFENYLVKTAEQSSNQLIAVRKLSGDRQALIHNAIKHSPKFYALGRAQYDRLKALTRYPSHPFDFDVDEHGRGYSLKLIQSREEGFQALNEDHANLAKHRRAADVEIRLAFNSLVPNFDDSTAPLFIAICRDGRVRAVRYQLRYHANSIAAYEGNLSEVEAERWFARVGAAFHLPQHRADYDRGLGL